MSQQRITIGIDPSGVSYNVTEGSELRGEGLRYWEALSLALAIDPTGARVVRPQGH